jgi:hypothetical protein
MIVVAVIATTLGLVLGAVRLKRLKDYYRGKALEHAQGEVLWDLSGGGLGTRYFDGTNLYQLSPSGEILRWYGPFKAPAGYMGGPIDVPWIEGTQGLPESERNEMNRRVLTYRARAAYHAAMRRKYERAAARPWEVVTPDPPEPEL